MREYSPPPGSIPTLPVPDLSAVRRAHLIGIGGAGMSGITRLLLDRGIAISGSDLKDGPCVAALRDAGATVTIGHDAASLGDPDVVIISTAIPAGNPELRAAAERGIPVLVRAQVLAALMREHRSIAVAGTHGKTTTTSMIAVVLEHAGMDPTYVVGGELNESGSNARSGTGPLFVAEADESDGSFLLLRPEIAVVTNVEADHLDFFVDLVDVEASFVTFCRGAERLIACGDDPGVRRVLNAAGVDATRYGEGEENDVRVEILDDGPAARGTIIIAGTRVDIALRLPGRHYVMNAAAAIAVAAAVGVDPAAAAVALEGFTGVRRRFETVGESDGIRFIDDYAHHPTEIAATLQGARGLLSPADGHHRLVAVFQPHRYTRTAVMFRALGASLAAADVVVVTDVYGAGETPDPGVTGKLVLDALADAAPGKRIVYLPSRADVAPFLAHEVRRGDLVLTLGAGDVTMVAAETLARVMEDAGG